MTALPLVVTEETMAMKGTMVMERTVATGRTVVMGTVRRATAVGTAARMETVTMTMGIRSPNTVA